MFGRNRGKTAGRIFFAVILVIMLIQTGSASVEGKTVTPGNMRGGGGSSAGSLVRPEVNADDGAEESGDNGTKPDDSTGSESDDKSPGDAPANDPPEASPSETQDGAQNETDPQNTDVPDNPAAYPEAGAGTDTGAYDAGKNEVPETPITPGPELIASEDTSGDEIKRILVRETKADSTVFEYDALKTEIPADEDYCPEIKIKDNNEVEIISVTVNGSAAAFSFDGEKISVDKESLEEGENVIDVKVKDHRGNIHDMTPWKIIKNKGSIKTAEGSGESTPGKAGKSIPGEDENTGITAGGGMLLSRNILTGSVIILMVSAVIFGIMKVKRRRINC